MELYSRRDAQWYIDNLITSFPDRDSIEVGEFVIAYIGSSGTKRNVYTLAGQRSSG